MSKSSEQSTGVNSRYKRFAFIPKWFYNSEIIAGILCFFIFFYCYLYTLRTNKVVGDYFDADLLVISSLYMLLWGFVIIVINKLSTKDIPDIIFLVTICGIDLLICWFVACFLDAGFPTKIDPMHYHEEAVRAIDYSTWEQFSKRYGDLWLRRSLFSFFIPYKLFGATTAVLKIASTLMHLLLGCNIYFICKKVFGSKNAAQLGISLYFLVPTPYFSINSASHDLWGAAYLSFCLFFFIMLSDGRLIDYAKNIRDYRKKKQIRSFLLICYLLFGYILFAFLTCMARGAELLIIIQITVLIYMLNSFLEQCKARNLSHKTACILFSLIFLFALVIPSILVKKCNPPFTHPSYGTWYYRTYVSTPNTRIIGDHYPYNAFPGGPKDDFFQTLYVSTVVHATNHFYSQMLRKSIGLFSLNDIHKMVADSDAEIIQKAHSFQNRLLPVTCTILWTFVLFGLFYLSFIRRRIDYRMSFGYVFSLFLFGTILFGEGQPNYLQSMYPFIIVLGTEGILSLNQLHFVRTSKADKNNRSVRFYIPILFIFFGIVLFLVHLVPGCLAFFIKGRDFVDLSNPVLSSNVSFTKDMTDLIETKKNFIWTYIPLPSKRNETITAEWPIPDYPSTTINGFFDITKKDLDFYDISLTCGNNELIIPPRDEWIEENGIRPPRNPMYSIFINQSVKETGSKLTLKITCKDDLAPVASSFERMICVHSFQFKSK